MNDSYEFAPARAVGRQKPAPRMNRREFLKCATACGAALSGVQSAHRAFADASEAEEVLNAPQHELTVIAGSPLERGRDYGRRFADKMRAFLEREILKAFVTPTTSRDDLLRYAGACLREVRAFSPQLGDELGGMAEGAGLRAEEVVLMTLHEELSHRGDVPIISHCTAMAAGPPSTSDGNTYVGQSWDWMKSVFGLSQMTLWKRTEGPSVLAYSYPGLWISAGLNSAGIALVWTTGAPTAKGPRIGIPAYVLIAQMLYQSTLKDAVAEARRAKRAGWFSYVLGDAVGNLVSVEGAPDDIEVVYDRGGMARVYYASARMTHTPPGRPVELHPQCVRMRRLLDENKGRIDAAAVRRFFGDHDTPICKHPTAKRGGASLDVMVFNTTAREAHVTRGPACRGRWKTFRFDDK